MTLTNSAFCCDTHWSTRRSASQAATASADSNAINGKECPLIANMANLHFVIQASA